MNMKAGQYLTFKLAENSYGVCIDKVREINRMTEIAKVPEAPEYVAGVMNLRGKIISVVDMRKRLHMDTAKSTKETCVIVVEAEGTQVGVIVDSVQAVIQLNDNQIDDSPVSEESHNFVKAIGKLDDGLIMLIDITHCLGTKEDKELMAA